MKSIFAVAAAISLSFLAFGAQTVHADYGETPSCTNQYGSTVECPPNHIVINKKVRSATHTNVFVENITSADTAYSAGSEIEYDIAVTNTSNTNFATVTVIDVFPTWVTFVSGPGRYEASQNKLTYELSNLLAGQTVHNRIVVKAKDASAFPNDLTCDIVNTATATGPGGQSDQDTASLCVQTKIMGVTTLPVAGFEDWAFVVPFLAMAVIGFGILGKGAMRP